MSSSRRRSLPPPELANYETRQSEVRVFLRADVRCYLCGELCGELESPVGGPTGAVLPYRPLGEREPRPTLWRSIRCPRCNGTTHLDEVETVREWIDHVNWRLDQPRRGRPPKWLVELRAVDAA